MKIAVELEIEKLPAIKKMRHILQFRGDDFEWNALVADSVCELQNMLQAERRDPVDSERLVEQLQSIIHRKLHANACACGAFFRFVSNKVLGQTYGRMYRILKANDLRDPGDFTYLIEYLSNSLCRDCSDLLDSGAFLQAFENLATERSRQITSSFMTPKSWWRFGWRVR